MSNLLFITAIFRLNVKFLKPINGRKRNKKGINTVRLFHFSPCFLTKVVILSGLFCVFLYFFKIFQRLI
jgi:hypothetical protein